MSGGTEHMGIPSNCIHGNILNEYSQESNNQCVSYSAKKFLGFRILENKKKLFFFWNFVEDRSCE